MLAYLNIVFVKMQLGKHSYRVKPDIVDYISKYKISILVNIKYSDK